MDALTGIAGRIQEIQSRMAQLGGTPTGTSYGSVLGSPVLGTVGTAASAAGSGTAGTSGTAMAFGQVLEAEIAASAPAASAAGSGKALLDAKGVPTELRQYGNGKVPAAALSELQGLPGHRLWAPAARSFEAMRSAAAVDGVTIGMTDSYRDFDTQVDLVRRKGLYSQGGLAATPGTSNHGWGIAVDLKLDSTAQAWMRANGSRYGFVEDVPREPWHWTYRPKNA